ncbi:complement factor H-like [Festucalex cinctus]
MNTVAQSCVLFLWMHTVTFVKCQECTRDDFVNGRLFNSNFDTTNMDSTYKNGQQVRVACAIGYTGFFKLTCAGGTWESRSTPCEPKPCGHPGESPNAKFELELGDDFVFGSQVKYTCREGYQMVSRINYRVCMANGWSGNIPVCEATRCPVVNVGDNVEVVGELEDANFGDVVRFSCKNRKEVLTGSSEMSCEEDGKWTNQPPICEEVKCGVPKIENAFMEPGRAQEYKEHDILPYRCNAKYKYVTDRPSTCSKVGIRAEWIPRPECEPVKCKVSLPALGGTRYEPADTSLFSPGARLTVTCGDSYWISTPRQMSAVSRCKNDGEWSIRPICQEVTCIRQRHSSVSWWNLYNWHTVKLGSTADYECRPGYKRTNDSRHVTCTRDGWIPDPPCQEITCDREDIPSANVVDANKQIYKKDERVYFKCKDSQDWYTITCSENGWHATVSCSDHQCKRLDLSNADIIRNSKDGYSKDETVQYACSNDPERKFTATCGSDGWIGILNCSACLQPEVLHGFVVGASNDRAYYTCDHGFKLASKGWWGVAKCIDGRWFGLQQCVANNSCVEMPVIANADIRHQMKKNGQEHSLRITCREGYQSQIESLSCVDGKWDSSGLSFNSICTPVAGTCDPPPTVENAVVLTSFQKNYSPGSQVTLECREQYSMEGKDTITCQNGQWDMLLKCKPYCSKPKRLELIMTFTDDREQYFNGEVLEYRCPHGGKSGGSATCVNGTWSEPIQCDVKPCPHPGETPNGHFEITEGDGFVFGTTIKYFCKPGYQMVSQTDTRTCLLNKWSGHVPVCEPKRCDPPRAEDGVTIEGVRDSEGVLPLHFITFSCNIPGKQLNGSSLVGCGQDGRWDRPFPTCEDISCHVEELGPHLSIDQLSPATRAARIGHKLSFRCSDEYVLTGFEENECLPNGQWEHPFPTCTEPCQLTDVPANVRVETRLQGTRARPGQKLRFSCRTRNQVLRGKAEVECLPNGQWSDPFPTCGAFLPCGRPPYVAGGDITTSSRSRYQHDETVEYKCQPYYKMEGRATMTCENGEWIGQIKCRKPCTVNKDLMSRHNVEFKYRRDNKLYSEHDDVIEFRCAWRTRHDGVLEMRQYCIDGEIQLPTCQ